MELDIFNGIAAPGTGAALSQTNLLAPTLNQSGHEITYDNIHTQVH